MNRIKIVAIAFAAALLLSSCSYGLTDNLSGTPSATSKEVPSAASGVLPESSAEESAATSEITGEPADSAAASSSEEAMPVNAGDTWKVILVNRAHPLPEGFTVDLTEVTGTYKFDTRAAGALKDMLAQAREDGIKLSVISTYRKQSTQERLYAEKVAEYVKQGYSEEDAKVEAAKWVAIPGTSEHQSGLAVDVVSADWYDTHDDLYETFEQTKEFDWLISHCVQYGFVLRFPKDKQEITGITYEPWHYRYVGKEAAEYLTQNNLCLEEYGQKN